MPGIDAYRRHGGIHEDQYRTSKQTRIEAQADIDDALDEILEQDVEFIQHCMGIGPDFEEVAPSQQQHRSTDR